jgi:hypothetical protein
MPAGPHPADSLNYFQPDLGIPYDSISSGSALDVPDQEAGSVTEAPQILLNQRLKYLRLPTVLREYGKLAKQAGVEELGHVQFLARMIELEMIDRERRMIDRRITRKHP